MIQSGGFSFVHVKLPIAQACGVEVGAAVVEKGFIRTAGKLLLVGGL